MILNAIAAKRKQRSEAGFEGGHIEATRIIQIIFRYQRSPLSDHAIETMPRIPGNTKNTDGASLTPIS